MLLTTALQGYGKNKMNIEKTTKVLWFSRHKMSEEQLNDLKRIYGNKIIINQVSKTITDAKEIEQEIKKNDVIAVVAPLHLQKQILEIAGNRPVIFSVSDRILTKSGGVEFKFKKWVKLNKIEIETEDL
jgi:hypothetical protein